MDSTPSKRIGPLRARLREETSEAHYRLEARLDLLAPDLTLPRYQRVLEALLGFHEPLEARLRAVGAAFEVRSRAAWLVEDLRALGSTPEQIAALPRCTRLPDLHGAPELAGCLYVVEGSRLGGKVIARTLGPRLGLPADRGLAFFAGAGEQLGQRWPAVLGFLEDAGAAAPERTVAAAAATFACLEGWLEARDALSSSARPPGPAARSP